VSGRVTASRAAASLLAALVALAAKPAASPGQSAIGARSCHAMAYAPSLGGIVAFGGAKACGVDVLTDTLVWRWNGVAWSDAGMPFPSPREDALVAFDTRRRTLVVHGGRNAAAVFRDTWELDTSATRWRRRSAATDPNPGALEHAAAAFDQRRGRLVVFGGGSRDGRMFDATWEWDGTVWRNVSSKAPTARVGHSMAWSPTDSAVLLYGGFNPQGSFRDLWKWDGARWTQLDTAGPATTEGPALVAAENTVWLVGAPAGGSSSQTLGVWARRQGRWVRLDRGAGPAPRVGQGIAYDPARRRLVLYGGFFPDTNRGSSETWEFDGTAWRLVAGAVTP
jgi:hypothetical protein